MDSLQFWIRKANNIRDDFKEQTCNSNNPQGNKRAGTAKTKISVANTHGLNSFVRAIGKTLLMTSSVCFLSETWMTKYKYTNIFEGKFSMVSHANRKFRGRPFRCLKLVANPNLQLIPLYQSQNVLAMEIRCTTIIGCHYEPNFEIDSIINELSQVIALIKDRHNMIIGGDCNVRPNSSEFSELIKFLETEGIVQISDASIPTSFIHKVAQSWTIYLGAQVWIWKLLPLTSTQVIKPL